MGKTRFDILASGAQTATAQGGAIPVAGIKAMAVSVDVTSASGTLTVYLQTSNDGGTTWFDLPYETCAVLAATAAEGTHSSPAIATGSGVNQPGARNIINVMTATAKALAKYSAFGDLIRPAWVISGGSATFTFSVKAIGES